MFCEKLKEQRYYNKTSTTFFFGDCSFTLVSFGLRKEVELLFEDKAGRPGRAHRMGHPVGSASAARF